MFILLRDQPEEWDLIDARKRWNDYQHYLGSIAEHLTPETLAFAIAPWHYDTSDPRCPHDAWLERLLIEETVPDDECHLLKVNITVRLLGAYHDGHIELRYEGVNEYPLSTSRNDVPLPGVDSGHGDWLYDEVRLSANGFALHEAEFSRGGHWLIECESMSAHWQPKQSPE